MPSPRLTPALIAEVCTRIKAGAFEQVAAESLGIPYATFQEWLRRGQRRRGGRLQRELAAAVLQARGQARLLAEMQLRDEDAKAWLLNGPGRETAAQAGWAGTGQAGRGPAPAEQAVQHRRWLELCAALLEALAPFPEARAKAADALARWQPSDA
jgi:hypothetical protein